MFQLKTTILTDSQYELRYIDVKLSDSDHFKSTLFACSCSNVLQNSVDS